MNPPENPASRRPVRSNEVSADQVRQYLVTHPDFFARNPELVERLIVPHACGPAESLIERQVSLLRVRNRTLERRLKTLIDTARDNESLQQRVWALGLRLLECDSPEVLFDVLYHGLCRDFRADAVSVRVHLDPDRAQVLVPTRSEFVTGRQTGCETGRKTGRNSGPDTLALLQELFELEEAACGMLSGSARVGLFDWPAQGTGSGVVVPFSVAGSPGVFGLASRDATRFDAEMGTTFLEQLGGMLGIALARLLNCVHAPKHPPTHPSAG